MKCIVKLPNSSVYTVIKRFQADVKLNHLLHLSFVLFEKTNLQNVSSNIIKILNRDYFIRNI